ncbi:lysozyme inhibitor LprI family protein [Sulfurovum sp. NBC37-1]|uniref:lysozyme inhibitor LprI family protein n=1 Tax=Sulfurovum sp. (strain NBC37-1) TaxID=387093 RepID=UPI001305281D|nr:lysozyme inhibitor LprI family protein [Sulfurovum sp. NBC37-1]
MLILSKKYTQIPNLFFFMIVFLSFGVNSYAETHCDMDAANKGIQSAMNICAAEDYHKANRLLNTTYKQLLDIHKKDKTFTSNLIVAQKAWIKFRDAEVKMILTYADQPGNYGSMNSLLWSMEMLSLTEQRIKVLQGYIKDGILDQPN